jgi:hypothetical protein
MTSKIKEDEMSKTKTTDSTVSTKEFYEESIKKNETTTSSSNLSEQQKEHEEEKQRNSNHEEEDDDDEDEDEDEEENESHHDAPEFGENGQNGCSHNQNQTDLNGENSSRGSPVRRLPSMLRPPPSNHASGVYEPQMSTRSYERSDMMSSRPLYMGGVGGGVVDPNGSMSSYSSSSSSSSMLRPQMSYYSHGGSDEREVPRGHLYTQECLGANALNGMGSTQVSTQSPLGQKRRLMQYDHHQQRSRNSAYNYPSHKEGPSPSGQHHEPPQFETRGSHGPRDETRYETWTSKQLRKKCSHLKLRGLKNVKKHVMVEALYRYYRNLRQKEAAASSLDQLSGLASNGRLAHQEANERYQQYERSASANGMNRLSGGGSSNGVGTNPSEHTSNSNSMSVSSSSSSNSRIRKHPPMDDESKMEMNENDTPVTTNDVIRLVHIVLSPEFVDRLASELSRWQFWVDIREKYIASLRANGGGLFGRDVTDANYVSSRNFKWSSMQLWEIWKELSFAYTKTCYDFTASGADERDYVKFCEGRPDVYYLHQRLLARPDLLHLIKSNEYMDEKATSDANDSIVAQSGSPHANKRFKPIIPGPSKNFPTSQAIQFSSTSHSSSGKGMYNRSES